MSEWDEQIPGIDDNWGGAGSTSAMPPPKRKSRLADMISALGGAGGGMDEGDDEESAASDRLVHRVNDDPIQGRSGGPGAIMGSIAQGQVTGGGERGGYQDPGTGRLADLMGQRRAMDAPPPKLGIKQRLINAIPDLLGVGITGAAFGMGGLGATEGAEQGYEAGVERRQKVKDLATQRKEAEKLRLSQEIDNEARAGEQRTFQHGEDVLRQQTAEHGMDERARQAQAAETGRNQRLVETIAGQGTRQQAGFDQQDELEDRKQTGRMALQMAKSDAQMAVQRYKTAHPNQNLPPVLTKAFGTYQQSQSRMDVMQQSYEEAIKDPGNSQAMLNLTANHLGMTMGLQPGARMNQAIINEAIKSGYLDERIQAHFGPDGYLTGVVLTPRQMKQMLDLAKGRLLEDARAVRETEAYLGRSGSAPINPRVPPSEGGGAAAGAGGAGATAAPRPPRDPDPGMKWQYNSKTKQFREVPIIAK